MAFNPRYNFKRTLHAAGHPPPHNSFIEIFAAPPPPPPPPSRTLHEEEIVAARRKKMRSLLDIDLNAPHQGGDAPAAAASGSAAAKGTNRGIVVEKVVEEGRERRRRRRRWEALLDAAAIAVIHEYERNIGMEDMEFQAENRIRNPKKFGGGGGDFENSWSRGNRRRSIGGAWGFEVEAVASAPPHRSKRRRALALPNRYKDSVIGASEVAASAAEENEGEDEEFSRRRKSQAAFVDADRKPRRVYRYQEW